MIYVSISFICILLFVVEISIKGERSTLFYVGAFLCFFILAFRGDDIGGDTIRYCKFFDGRGDMYGTVDNPIDNIELGFIWFCRFLNFFGNSHWLFIFATSSITLLPFLYLVKRESGYKTLPLCAYMLLWGILSVTQTAIRQNIAVAFLFGAYIVYTSKNIESHWTKLFLTTLLIICAVSFHSSVIFVIPIIVASIFIKINKRNALIIVVLSLIISLFSYRFFERLFEQFNTYLYLFDASNHFLIYSERMQYTLNDEVSFNRLGPTSLYTCLIVLLSTRQNMESIYTKLLIIGCSLFNIGAAFPMMFRVIYPLLIMGIIATPDLIKPKNLRVNHLILIFLLLFFLRVQYNYFSTYHKDASDKMLPYTFIFQ